jgi:hypothetical protein
VKLDDYAIVLSLCGIGCSEMEAIKIIKGNEMVVLKKAT